MEDMTKVRPSPVVLRELLKESQDQQAPPGRRDPPDPMVLQASDSQDSPAKAAPRALQGSQAWANQASQACRENPEEKVNRDQQEKWAPVAERGRWVSRGPRVPLVLRVYQASGNQGVRDYQVSQGPEESRVTRVFPDCLGCPDRKETKASASRDSRVTKGCRANRALLVREACRAWASPG